MISSKINVETIGQGNISYFRRESIMRSPEKLQDLKIRSGYKFIDQT